jgi:hypothetical protein
MKATNFLLENYELLRQRKKQAPWFKPAVRIIHLTTTVCPELDEPVPVKVLRPAIPGGN